MSGSRKRMEMGHVPFNKMRTIGGKKWEYPVPKSKAYWEKLCDDMAKKLVKVRDPSSKLSYCSSATYHSKYPNSKTGHENYSQNFPDFDKSNVTLLENSIHKVSCIEGMPSQTEKHCISKPLENSTLKATTSAPLKCIDPAYDASPATNLTRIPKLNIVSSQPSFSRISSHATNCIPVSGNLRNVQKQGEKTLSIDRGLPPLHESCTTFSTEATSTKLLKSTPTSENLSKELQVKHSYKTISNNTKSKETPQRNTLPSVYSSVSKNDLKTEYKEVESKNPSDEINKIESEEEIKQSAENRRSLKYSVRRAYKALKFLTANKKLDFQPTLIEHLSKESVSDSSNNSTVSIDETFVSFDAQDAKRSEEDSMESFCFQDVQKKLKRMSLKNLQSASSKLQYSTSKSETQISKTIPTGSRSTSRSSPEFVYPETWKSRSSQVLATIPQMSGFPRKNNDRCLSCMYRSFGRSEKRGVSIPKITSARSMLGAKEYVTLPRDVSEDSNSSSVTLSNFGSEVEQISNYEVQAKDVRIQEDFKSLKSPSRELISFSSQAECEKLTKQKDTNYEGSSKTITIHNKAEKQADQLTSLHDVNTVKTSPLAITPSLERFNIPSLLEENSEEEDSLLVSVSDDLSKKCLAPCHAPTIFRPSLEPLRALKWRKPTTLQARIALNENTSAKKNISIDYDDIPDKEDSKAKATIIREVSKTLDSSDKSTMLIRIKENGEDSKGKGEETLPVNRTLTKSKSEKLILETVESILNKEGSTSRKAISFSDKIVPVDTPSDRSINSEKEVESHDNTQVNGTGKESLKFTKNLPLMSMTELIKVLRKLDENPSATNVLDTLCKEFSIRLSKDFTRKDLTIRKNHKIATRLMKLLTDSKRYTRTDKFPSDLVFSSKQPPLCNPRQLRRILPLESYNLIAPLLGMPKWYPKKAVTGQSLDMKRHRVSTRNSSGDMSFDLEVHPPSLKGIKFDDEKIGHHRFNPYALFLMKPRRKAVTWRPLTEQDLKGYDPDATLKMRIDNIMKKICQDFSQWISSLGGTDKVIDEEVLRDMFEIDFKAEACRAMQISIREMPTVPTEVALTRNSPGASKLAMTRKHLIRDAKAEQKPAKVTAFGSTMPCEIQFVPPNNEVEKRWLQCENVPRDLETMEVVWKDITHLESVKGFVKWLQEHPEVQPPEALKTIVSMDINALRQTEDDETFAHLELDINQIENLKVADDGLSAAF